MVRTLKARTLVTATGTVEFPVITLAEDGTIADIFADPRALAGETDTLTAAFLDVHTHGAVGRDVMSADAVGLGELGRFLASRGVGHYLPTTVTAPVDETLWALESLADLIERDVPEGEARAVGIHLEGPFLSHAKRGVHSPENLLAPSVDMLERFQAAARGHIALMTVAPEVDGALEMIRYAVGCGVRVSVGHSNATAAETLAAVDAGATSATHTFNAMRAMDHREPGILGTVLDDDRLFAELICDGVHVAPSMVRLWLKAKGRHKAILVTDAMSAAGLGDGEYALAGMPVVVAGGRAVLADAPKTLAGSLLTMDLAVENLRRFTGASVGEAVGLASWNPAAMLGRGELVSVEPGSVANLNRMDGEGRLVGTYLRGRLVDNSE